MHITMLMQFLHLFLLNKRQRLPLKVTSRHNNYLFEVLLVLYQIYCPEPLRSMAKRVNTRGLNKLDASYLFLSNKNIASILYDNLQDAIFSHRHYWVGLCLSVFVLHDISMLFFIFPKLVGTLPYYCRLSNFVFLIQPYQGFEGSYNDTQSYSCRQWCISHCLI